MALEARAIITASDQTGEAFKSVEAKVRSLEKCIGGMAKAIDAVDKVARSVAPVSTRLNGVAEQVMRTTAATRGLAAEQAKLQAASEKLDTFKKLQTSFAATRATFNEATAQVKALAAAVEQAEGTAARKAKAAYQAAQQTVAEAARAFESQKEALLGAKSDFEALEGPLTSVRSAEQRLAESVERTTAALAEQGRTAARSSEQLAAAVRREEESQRRRAAAMRQFTNEVLPFAGPGILHGTMEGVKAGATIQERIAQLQTSGAKPDEIEAARADYRSFSKTHAGVLEQEYLAGYKDARVIAPGEAFDMAQLGARYRAALRNSGISSSEGDVGNVMRIMDELGLKSMPEREDFLSSFLKSQQAFGDQIKTETALSAYRNAKQSIYDWSPEFRNKYFPTLLQSSGQQGGTEMMTALNNYIGHHMQKTEIESLIAAGFVRPQDVETDHGRTTFRDNAQLFEQDVFKKNIAQWAWDFHDAFMKRSGATEDGFGDLIAKMPRNMAALIAFLDHNRARIERDAETLDKPVGLAAESNAALANNPIAGLAALRDGIEQFAAAVTQPAMEPIGHTLAWLAGLFTQLASAVSAFDKDHPDLAKLLGGGAIAGGMGIGGWLSLKLLSGFGSLLTGGGGAQLTGAAGALGGSAAALDSAALALDSAAVALGGEGAVKTAADAAPAAAALVAGWLGRILGVASVMSLPALIDAATDDNRSPEAKAEDDAIVAKLRNWLSPSDAIARRALDPDIAELVDRDYRDRQRGGVEQSPEARRGAAMHELAERELKVSLDPASKADINVTVRVEAGSSLISAAASATAKASGNLSADVGVSSAGVAPNAPGRWDR
jgi:hypothetical protein